MLASLGEGGGELRAAIERVASLARLDLDEFGDDLEALGLGESGDGDVLRLKPEPRTALLASADPAIGDQRFHHDGDLMCAPVNDYTTV